MFNSVRFSSYNTRRRIRNERCLAQYYASIFQDCDYFSVDSALEFDAHCLLSDFDGAHIGFMCTVGTEANAADYHDRHGLDALFSARPHPDDLPLAIPLPPPSFGFELPLNAGGHELTWQTYYQLRSEVSYRAAGNQILFCQRNWGGRDLKYREPLRQKLLMGVRDHVVDFEITSPARMLAKAHSSRVAVLGPGVGPQFMDRSMIQLLAVGCCVISPTLSDAMPSPFLPNVHYVACQDDYSDLEEILEGTSTEKFVEIGRRAKDHFDEHHTPRPLRQYIRASIGQAGLHRTMNRPRLLAIDDDLRMQRSVSRYREARKHCYGAVLDFGCGSGYGVELLRANPDVKSVWAIEVDPLKSRAARRNFRVDFSPVEKCDVVVALEVIEHLHSPEEFVGLVEARDASRVIVSVPNFPSTHFNQLHAKDWTEEELTTFLPGFRAKVSQFSDSFFVVYDRS